MSMTSRRAGRRRGALAGQGLPRRVTVGVAVLAVGLGSAVVVTTPAYAEVTVIQVTNTDDDGPGSLRAALVEAQGTSSDDRITFAPGVAGTIALTSGELDVAVGGTSGSLSIEGPGPDDLIVDAGFRRGPPWETPKGRVLDVQGLGGDPRPTVLVSGLTLTGGFTSEEGGALRATGADVTLDRVVVSGSLCLCSGYLGGGGGVSVVGGSLLVTSSRITGNSAGDYEARGGGIFVDASEAAGAALTVHDSTISDNTAGEQGGGIHFEGSGPVTVTGSTVSGNTAKYVWTGMEAAIVYGDGGGISASDLTVVDSRIIGNWAARHGGGLAGDSVVVTGSTVADNVAGEAGGGIRADGTYADGELRVESSTLTGNRADYGGGLAVASDMTTEVMLSTIAANAAVTGGGLSSSADVALQGSIVAMNTGGDLAGDGRTTLDRSLVQEPRGATYVDNGGSIMGLDPLLGPLADHGGPTETLLPASNSPVIDLGDAFGAVTDQRGFPRPVDDAEVPDASDGSDIGALELTQVELTGLPQVGSTARPVISGRVRVGETLRTDGGTWEPADASLSYQWLRKGVPISGATSASYTLTPDDYDRNWYGADGRKRVSVLVTAEAEGHHDGSVESDYTRYVRRGQFSVSRPAQVTGKLRVGATLRARPRLRAISPRPPGVFVMWYLDGRMVDRARDHRRFELKPRMRGKRVKVRFLYENLHGYHQLKQVVKKRRPVR